MSDTLTPSDTLPTPIRAVLALYAEALSEVRFPDVSAARLDAQVAAVGERAAAVEAAHQALAEASAGLAAEHAALAELAKKALAYARIYAVDRPELAATLDGIELGGASAPARKRGRPKKQSPEAPALRFEEDAALAAD